MESPLRATLADAVAWLSSRGLPCALIGGLAVSLRGQPRMTVDVDIVVLATIDQALELVADLSTTPFAPLFEGVEDVVRRAFILPLRHRVTGVRLDIALGMSGFERQAVQRATPIVLGAVSIPVVKIEDLLVMKAIAGRPQDEQDIRGLVRAQRGSIDWSECLSLAEQLGSALDIDIVGSLRASRQRATAQNASSASPNEPDRLS